MKMDWELHNWFYEKSLKSSALYYSPCIVLLLRQSAQLVCFFTGVDRICGYAPCALVIVNKN